MAGRSSVRPAGRTVPAPGTIQSRSHMGRCRTAYEGVPSGPGTGSEKITRSLFGYRLRSVFRSGWNSKWKGPSRFQVCRSSETASAGFGPSGP